MKQQCKRRERGTSLIEFVLDFLFLFFLFIGAVDFGFFGYALIAVQNAVRVAALYTSSKASHDTDQTTACSMILTELQTLPNYSSLPASCNASPLTVTVTTVTAPDNTTASKVTVTYQTLQLIPITGLPGILSITRSLEMRVRG
jgi:Flp pilus assembly protein TadG